MPIAFVDESQVYLAGRKHLLYATYLCHDLSVPASGIHEVRQRFNVPETVELKWTVDTGDKEKNAAVKDALLGVLDGPDDRYLVSITATSDKDHAFRRALCQIHGYLSSIGESSFSVIYDESAFADRRSITAFLHTLDHPTCSLFAQGDSALTAGLTSADVFAGSFAFMVHAYSRRPVREVQGRNEEEFIPLDALFYEVYRRKVPGQLRYFDGTPEDRIGPETAFRYTPGTGLWLDPEEQLLKEPALHDLIHLYQGPIL